MVTRELAAVIKAAPYGWDGSVLRAVQVDAAGEVTTTAAAPVGGGPTKTQLDLNKAALFGYDPVADLWRALEVDATGALKVV